MDADDYFSKAENLSTKRWYDYFYDTTDKEMALDCYLDAANLYKSNKQYQQSVVAFEKAGELAIKNKYQYKAAQHFLDAAHMAKLSNLDYVDLTERASKLYVLQGRFHDAAKALTMLMTDYNQIDIYKRMIDYYNMNINHEHDKFKCYRALLVIYITNKQYDLILPMLEELINYHIHHGLAQSSADEHLLSYFVIYFVLYGKEVESTLDKLINNYSHYKNKPVYTWMLTLINIKNQNDYNNHVDKQMLVGWQNELLKTMNVNQHEIDESSEDLR